MIEKQRQAISLTVLHESLTNLLLMNHHSACNSGVLRYLNRNFLAIDKITCLNAAKGTGQSQLEDPTFGRMLKP